MIIEIGEIRRRHVEELRIWREEIERRFFELQR